MTDSTEENLPLDDSSDSTETLVYDPKLNTILEGVEKLALASIEDEEEKKSFIAERKFPMLALPKKPVPEFKKTKVKLETVVKTPETPKTPEPEDFKASRSFDAEEQEYLEGKLTDDNRDRLLHLAKSFHLMNTPKKRKSEINKWRIDMVQKAEIIREVTRTFIDEYPPPPDFRESRALKILIELKEITFGWQLPVDGAKGELPPHPLDHLKKIMDLISTWKDLKKHHPEVRRDWTDYCNKLFMNCIIHAPGDSNQGINERIMSTIEWDEKRMEKLAKGKKK